MGAKPPVAGTNGHVPHLRQPWYSRAVDIFQKLQGRMAMCPICVNVRAFSRKPRKVTVQGLAVENAPARTGASTQVDARLKAHQGRFQSLTSFVRTVGGRLGLLARIESMGPSRSCLSTWRYKNNRALRAWLGVEAATFHGQVGEKGFDPSTGSGHRFGDAHLTGVSFLVKQDVALDPGGIGLSVGME